MKYNVNKHMTKTINLLRFIEVGLLFNTVIYRDSSVGRIF